jgi:hypothetical protein
VPPTPWEQIPELLQVNPEKKAKFGKQTLFNNNHFKKFCLETHPIYYVLGMHFNPPKKFQLANSISIHIKRL